MSDFNTATAKGIVPFMPTYARQVQVVQSKTLILSEVTDLLNYTIVCTIFCKYDWLCHLATFS